MANLAMPPMEEQEWLDVQSTEVREAYENAYEMAFNAGYEQACINEGVDQFVEFIDKFVVAIEARGVCPKCGYGIGYNWPTCDICTVARTKLT